MPLVYFYLYYQYLNLNIIIALRARDARHSNDSKEPPTLSALIFICYGLPY